MNGRRLYEEIGGVSERYLQQAAGYRARKRNPAWRVVLIAAALMLVGALVLGMMAMSLGIGLLGLLFDAMDQPGDQDQQPAISTIAEMERTLTQEQRYLHAREAEELALFGGRPLLIWSDGESGEYYCANLSQEELKHMLYLMQGRRTEFTTDSEQPSMQIWICLGDGLVISPYLRNTPGNAGHGEVFDYDPELEMTEDLAQYIADCVLS